MQDWLVRCCELVDRYRPQLLYFDWWIQVEPMKPYLKKLAAYYYNRAKEWGRPAVINYKFDAFGYHTAVPDIERGQLAAISRITGSAIPVWPRTPGAIRKGTSTKHPGYFVRPVRCMQQKRFAAFEYWAESRRDHPRRGCHILRHIGRWLRENGEGIYDTTHWKVYGEGPTEVKEGHFTDTLRGEFTPQDIRFTTLNSAGPCSGHTADGRKGVVRSTRCQRWDGAKFAALSQRHALWRQANYEL